MKLPTLQKNTVHVFALVAGLSLATSSRATVPVTDLPSFDGLPIFAQLGNQITEHNATVNGNVGVSSGGMFELDNPGTVNGNLFQAAGASVDIAGDLNGSLFNNQDLSTQQSTVFSASSAMAALTPDQIISGDQTTSLSFDVPAGQVYVLNLNGGLDLKMSDDITLTGGGSLVLNIMGSFSLQGSASIVGTPQNIFINYLGTGFVTTDENNLVDGQIFFPNAGADLKSTFFGAIYSGDQNVELMANATLNAEPVPLILAGLGGLSTILLRRRVGALKLNLRRK